MKKSSGTLLALMSTALGGLNAVSFKKLLEWMPYHEIALVEGIFLTLFFFFLGGIKFKKHSLKECAFLLIGGAFQAFGALFFYLSLLYLPPLEFSFLGRNQVLFSILLGIFFLGERPSWMIGLAMGFALLGAFFFTFVNVDLSQLLGLFFAVLYCLFFALRGFMLKIGPPLETPSLLFWGSFLGLFVIVGDILWIEKGVFDFQRAFLTPSTLAIVLTSFFAQGIGLSLYFKAIYRGDFSSVSSVRATSPLFVALYSFFIFEYVWTSNRLLGLLFSSLSILLFFLENRRQKKGLLLLKS